MKKNILRVFAATLSVFVATTVLSTFTLSSAAPAAKDATAEYQWGRIKQGGGGWVTGVIAHPKQKELVYAKTDVGGAYILNTKTNQWDQIITVNSLPQEMVLNYPGRSTASNVENMGLDPNKPEVLFVALSENGNSAGNGTIIKSTDYGKTFVKSNAKIYTGGNDDGRMYGETRFSVDPNNSNIVYYGSRKDGLLKSTDGGLTWEQVNKTTFKAMPNSVYGVQAVFMESSTNIYVLNAGTGIWYSKDGGATFTNIHRTTAPFVSSDFSNGIGYVAIDGISVNGEKAQDTIVKLENGTATVITPQYISDDASSICTDPRNNKRVIVASEGLSFMAVSNDGGNNWKPLMVDHETQVLSKNIYWLETTGTNSKLSLSTMRIDPFNSSKVWMPEGMGMWVSTNFSAKQNKPVFNNVSEGIEELCATDVVALKNRTAITNVMDRIGFYHRNLDEFPSYQLKISNRFGTGGGVNVSPTDPNFITVSGYNHHEEGSNPNYNDSGYSTDGGKTWKVFDSIRKQTHPKGLEFGDIVISANNNKNMLWNPQHHGNSSNRNAKLYYTKDGGKTWLESKISGYKNVAEWWQAASKFVAADQVKEGVFYAYSETGDLFKSTDGGETFTSQSKGVKTVAQSGEIKAVPGREGHVWFVGGTTLTGSPDDTTANAVFRKSTDGGKTFTSLLGWKTAYAIGFGAPKAAGSYPTVYAYGIYNDVLALYRSTDEGATWDKISDAPLGIIDKITCIDGDKDVYGRVYFGFGGTGFGYGELLGTANNSYKTEYKNQTSYISVNDMKITKISGKVTAKSKLTVYKSSKLTGKKLRTIKSKKAVVVKSVTGKVAKVKLGKKYGYAKVSGLKFAKKQNVIAKVKTNAYAKAKTTAYVLATIKKGQKVQATISGSYWKASVKTKVLY